MQKRIIRGFTLAAASMFCLNAYAVAPGFYMGIMTGPATNSGGTVQAQTGIGTTTPADTKSSQWGTRIFMGNKINNYAGAELGLTLYSGIKYDTKDVDTCSSPQLRVRDFDLLGKFEMPTKYFTPFVKAGISLVYVNESASLNPDLTMDCGESKNTTNIKPKIAIGGAYDLNQSWVVDFSWTRTMISSKVSNVDLFALGLTYHFVDVYCGQFLCE